MQAIRDLEREVGAPASIQECGIDEKLFFDNLQRLSENAHEDQCTTANPRYPLISEIAELYTKAYYGNKDFYRLISRFSWLCNRC